MPPAITLAALALAHAFDYASFLVMIQRHGMAAEANPVVVYLAAELGLPGLTLAKVVVIALAAVLVTIIAPRRRGVAMGLLMFGVGAGLLGGFSNIATL